MNAHAQLERVKTSLTYRLLIGIFVTLFFAVQSFTVTHATSFGDEHHDHDGVACSVTVLADDHNIVAPVPQSYAVIRIETVETVFPKLTSAAYLAPQGRAPPPRAPPTTI